ncbi:transposase, partial [Acinetobacter baumannii]|nr:transposase [Acinetobacter baumannii]
HKRADIQELLEQQGHKILWLPAYSPDLNPIEQMWAWVKRKRKRKEWLIDSVDELFRVFFESCMNNKVV